MIAGRFFYASSECSSEDPRGAEGTPEEQEGHDPVHGFVMGSVEAV
jgi:hypothetical protein